MWLNNAGVILIWLRVWARGTAGIRCFWCYFASTASADAFSRVFQFQADKSKGHGLGTQWRAGISRPSSCVRRLATNTIDHNWDNGFSHQPSSRWPNMKRKAMSTQVLASRVAPAATATPWLPICLVLSVVLAFCLAILWLFVALFTSTDRS